MNTEAKTFVALAGIWPADKDSLAAGASFTVHEPSSSVDEAVLAWADEWGVSSVEGVRVEGLAILEIAKVRRSAFPFAPKDLIKQLGDDCLYAWASEYGDTDNEPKCSPDAYNEARAAIGDACAKLAETLPITRYTKVGERTLSRDEVVEILKREGVIK